MVKAGNILPPMGEWSRTRGEVWQWRAKGKVKRTVCRSGARRRAGECAGPELVGGRVSLPVLSPSGDTSSGAGVPPFPRGEGVKNQASDGRASVPVQARRGPGY